MQPLTSLLVSALLSTLVSSEPLLICSRVQRKAAKKCLKSKMLPPHTKEKPIWKPIAMMVPNTLIPWMDMVITKPKAGSMSLPQCFLYHHYERCLSKNVFSDGQRCSIPEKSQRMIRMGFEPLCAPEWTQDKNMRSFKKCSAKLRNNQAIRNCNKKFLEATEDLVSDSNRSHCMWVKRFSELHQCWKPVVNDKCSRDDADTIERILIDDVSLISEEEGC